MLLIEVPLDAFFFTILEEFGRFEDVLPIDGFAIYILSPE
jgi:hypothetical protein